MLPAALSPATDAPAPRRALVAGGGIGGLAAALACARSACAVQLHEQAPAFTEVGAGVQLGPNVTRRLAAWGLGDGLRQAAVQPSALVVRSAMHGGVLAQRPLGDAIEATYGAPYLSIHRAALHRLLLDAVRAQPGVSLHLGSTVTTLQALPQGVRAGVQAAPVGVDAALHGSTEADLAVIADGVWSRLRTAVLGSDTPPEPTGHLAYRALVVQDALPPALRSDAVTVWLGPRLHAVRYPIQDPATGAQALNLVLVVHARDVDDGLRPAGDDARWDHAMRQGEWSQLLAGALGNAHRSLREVLEAMPQWQRWVLHDRAPLASAAQMARAGVALLGDAAHPMRPYLAQGAGMAIEDAFELQQCLTLPGLTAPQQLQRWAQARWARNARVQARSRRNGRIFHAQGLVRWGRDAAMRLLGERLLDQPWLYRY
ncbi:MAG: FAD-dependent monooxygenase [Burkholderiaceae bacterium]